MVTAIISVGAAAAYGLLFVRGLRRSHVNIMARSFRERHSWRWWLWTITCRPGFAIANGRCYLWLPLPFRSPSWRWYVRLRWRFGKMPLPGWLPPRHMRGKP